MLFVKRGNIKSSLFWTGSKLINDCLQNNLVVFGFVAVISGLLKTNACQNLGQNKNQLKASGKIKDSWTGFLELNLETTITTGTWQAGFNKIFKALNGSAVILLYSCNQY